MRIGVRGGGEEWGAGGRGGVESNIPAAQSCSLPSATLLACQIT